MKSKEISASKVANKADKQSKIIKSLRDKLRRCERERDHLREKYKDQAVELKKCKKRIEKLEKHVGSKIDKSQKVKGHQFSELQTEIAVKIRTNTSCSARDVATIMNIVNEATGGLLGNKSPCANTVDNWTNKCGLDAYGKAPDWIGDEPYAMIIDDSMIYGSQRLLLVLLAPACHSGNPLKHSDVMIGGMYAASSFNSEYIKEALMETAAKVDRDPEYVISDNASIMLKGTKMAGMEHHSDITHSLGMLLERAYKKEPDFCNFTSRISDVLFKYNMSKIAYLLPPKQRSISRFINMGKWVSWSHMILDRLYNIPDDEKDHFMFIPQNGSLIDELSDVMSCVRYIETKCKHEGLSSKTLEECIENIDAVMMRGNERMRNLGLSIKDFLRKETETIGTAVHNNSSDIIESTYGIYKSKKSPNKMYGITTLVLRLSLCGKTRRKDFDVVQSLTRIKMRDIQEWKQKNLLPNPASKRLSFFKKTA